MFIDFRERKVGRSGGEGESVREGEMEREISIS